MTEKRKTLKEWLEELHKYHKLPYNDASTQDDNCLIDSYYKRNPQHAGRPLMISCPCKKCSPFSF